MIYYKVGSERLTEEEYRAKYPRLWAEMRRREKEVRAMNLPPITRSGVDCARSSDRGDWRHEKDPYTGLDGRYMPQLARFQNDPKAVVKHRSEIEERGKRAGKKVERMA